MGELRTSFDAAMRLYEGKPPFDSLAFEAWKATQASLSTAPANVIDLQQWRDAHGKVTGRP